MGLRHLCCLLYSTVVQGGKFVWPCLKIAWSSYVNTVSTDGAEEIILQQHVVEHIERYKAFKMLRSSTASKPTPDVLTWAQLGWGRVSEIDVTHLLLTLIQFHSASHLISQYTSKCIHTISSRMHPQTYTSPVTIGEWRSSRCRTHWELSLCVRKPTICMGVNKDADQLRGNREADQRLCFCYTDSTILPLLISKISSF